MSLKAPVFEGANSFRVTLATATVLGMLMPTEMLAVMKAFVSVMPTFSGGDDDEGAFLG